MKNLFLLFLLNAYPIILFSQVNDSLSPVKIEKKGALHLWAFADIYYSWDFNQPPGHTRTILVNGNSPVFSHNMYNEFALNNGIIGINYDSAQVHASLALQTGTFVRANYAAEPTLFQLIYQATVGVTVCPKFRVDAGIMPSHIGAESALSINNPTLSRSLMAENTPYYETGIKATYEASKKWIFRALILNGWQNIAENNQNKALGTQIEYMPSSKIKINSSTFIGKEAPAYNALSTMRYFHDLYATYTTETLDMIASFDIGFQEKGGNRGAYIWYNPTLIARYWVTPKFAIPARIEYYHDPHQVIINAGVPEGFKTFSYSIGLDYKISPQAMWRIEGRWFQSPNAVYKENHSRTQISYSDPVVLTSLAIKLGKP